MNVYAKRVTDDSGSDYWMLYRFGEIDRPLVVLTPHEATILKQTLAGATAGEGQPVKAKRRER